MFALLLCFFSDADVPLKFLRKVLELFKDALDLAAVFRDFLPGDSRGPCTRSRNTRRGRVSRSYKQIGAFGGD